MWRCVMVSKYNIGLKDEVDEEVPCLNCNFEIISRFEEPCGSCFGAENYTPKKLYHQMTLTEAIEFSEKLAEGLGESSKKEFRQLATWFRELRMYKASKNNHPSIPELIFKAHNNAIEKGWWEEDKSLGDMIALMHSELSEALEDGRKGKGDTEIYYEGDKPCGIPIEFADLVIRVFDYCGAKGIDLEKAILEKMEFNKTRPHKHGKKF